MLPISPLDKPRIRKVYGRWSVYGGSLTNMAWWTEAWVFAHRLNGGM